MPLCHQLTKHSYMSVRSGSHMIDWDSQPRNHKIYPHFYPRYKLESLPSLAFLELAGGITAKKEFPNTTYYLRSVPSAGGLFPFELYLQIRGDLGIPKGLYHFEPHSASLVLLREIGREGVEPYFGSNASQEGIIFLISAPYFRSSWKYRERAIRYILLDGGHQLGAIYAALACEEAACEMVWDFDKIALAKDFGFGEEELFLAAIFSSTTDESKERIPLKSPLPYVSAYDYYIPNEFVKKAYNDTVNYHARPTSDLPFFQNTPKEILESAIIKRRSIRGFNQKSISAEEFSFIMQDITLFAMKHDIDIFYTAHLIDSHARGLYKNEELISEGDFRSKSRYLALEQNLGGQSAATFYITSNEVECYQKANMIAGLIGHLFYLRSEILGIGCSGIGAYYDDEAKTFLQTQNNILYLVSIGR